MGRHAAPRKRRGRPILSVLLAAALVPTSGPAAAPGPAAYTPPAEHQVTAPAVALTYDRPSVLTIPAPPPPPPTRAEVLQAFIARYEGQRPVIPGYDTAECMAIFSLWNYGYAGGDAYSAPGAQDVWLHNTWTAYDRVPATEPAQPGDVVIWSGSRGAYTAGGWGHIAIVVADQGDSLDAFGQNPNPATTLRLSKAGVLGYLRAHNLTL